MAAGIALIGAAVAGYRNRGKATGGSDTATGAPPLEGGPGAGGAGAPATGTAADVGAPGTGDLGAAGAGSATSGVGTTGPDAGAGLGTDDDLLEGDDLDTTPPPTGAPHLHHAGFDPGPPQPSNYDASGPVANTATPIPAPDHHPTDAIDEDAEEAAAAAEAAAIGGGVPDYPGVGLSEYADESFRPVEEGGGGEAEGQEIAEMELVEAAQPSDTMSDAQRQIEETIDAQANPHLGERPEPLSLTGEERLSEAELAAQAGAGQGPSFGGDPGSPGDAAAAEGTPRPADDEDDTQTWSGRTVDP